MYIHLQNSLDHILKICTLEFYYNKNLKRIASQLEFWLGQKQTEATLFFWSSEFQKFFYFLNIFPSSILYVSSFYWWVMIIFHPWLLSMEVEDGTKILSHSFINIRPNEERQTLTSSRFPSFQPNLQLTASQAPRPGFVAYGFVESAELNIGKDCVVNSRKAKVLSLSLNIFRS